MPRLLGGVAGLLSASGAVTHEGAAAFDLSVEDPLLHLVFTKGAALLEKSFYRTQAEELRAYAKALLAAERHEPGFGWKFAAYMRDPERGKGNRIQGSVAPAILAAAAPDSPFVEEYVYRCLRHRPDDVMLFVAHGKNLGLPLPSAGARRGMARALSEFDDYQIFKYAKKQAPLLERRAKAGAAGGRSRKSLRLVDALGLCKPYLDARLTKLYAYLHAPTREHAKLAEGVALLEARQRFFRGSNDAQDFADARLTHEQARSFLGNVPETWRRLLDIPGLVGDLAFLKNLRSMRASGLQLEALLADAKRRRFEGVWPHQVYAGYRAIMNGTIRTGRDAGEVFQAPAMPELAPVFDAVLARITEQLVPQASALGLADLSGSMFGAPLGGAQSSLFVGDISCLFSAIMASTLGYAAAFSDDVWLVGKGGRPPLRMADELRKGPGMGGTQVAGAVRHLLAILRSEPERPRPRTLFFFSDMQFHPPAQQSLEPMYGGNYRNEAAQKLLKTLPALDPRDPPLLALLKLWREQLGPIDIVLWNLAAYDASPTPSGMDHVLLLSGFDANSFKHVEKWQAGGSQGGKKPSGAAGAPVDANVELDVIRGF